MDIQIPKLTPTTRYKVWKAIDEQDAFFVARRIYVRNPQYKRQWTGFMIHGDSVQRIPNMEIKGKKTYQELPPDTTLMAIKINAPVFKTRAEAIAYAKDMNAPLSIKFKKS